ncbi:MAG: lysophospholipase, partial [Acutalibacter sp.]
MKETQMSVQEQAAALMEKMAQETRERTVESYRRLNKFIQPGKVLMVGSSLMEQFPINELLLDEGRTYTVYNRGIGGYTT